METATLLTDKDWSAIDGELCHVISFNHFASVQDGKIEALDNHVPYGTIEFEIKPYSNKRVTGFITHKLDFLHLWEVFKVRGIQDNEEVIIAWSRKSSKPWAKLFSPWMPKIHVMVCAKGAYKLMTDPEYEPDLTGESRWNAEKPLAEWKP